MILFFQFTTGVLFGIGLIVSDLTNPAKLLAFFDIASIPSGGWDPGLFFSLIGAVGVGIVGYRLVLGRARPLFAERFDLPTLEQIDRQLLTGAAIFGFGWGLVGLCPSPTLTALGFGSLNAVLYALAMVGGMYAARLLGTHLAR